MQKKITSALISVFYKTGLESLLNILHKSDVVIYSTGGTQKFIEELGLPCKSVESLTNYPSILGGRVKTLHPSVFGGILGRRDVEDDVKEMAQYHIPEIDLVIVDLYPFEEALKQEQQKISNEGGSINEAVVIEKIDVGGPSMIRAAAKNYKHTIVVAAKEDYLQLEEILFQQNGETTLEQRRQFAAKAFEVVMNYDITISNYFNGDVIRPYHEKQSLRYGENPHQQAVFYGDLKEVFEQLNGKELSYNNLVDVDAAIQLINEFHFPLSTSGEGAGGEVVFAIIKHNNVCGVAQRPTVKESWDAALAGDNESAFGGVLVANSTVDAATANAISEIFFEVLIAPAFDDDALTVLKGKKNRILLHLKEVNQPPSLYKSVINGTLVQNTDNGNYAEWKETGGRPSTDDEKSNLVFANIICKHLKSNAIALVKNRQLIGKGCGQTSRIDALKQAIEKAHQFNFDLQGAVLASDAFFPFNDCVQLAHAQGIEAFIQPGGSIRDKDSIDYCVQHNLAMVITGMRHFRH